MRMIVMMQVVVVLVLVGVMMIVVVVVVAVVVRAAKRQRPALARWLSRTSGAATTCGPGSPEERRRLLALSTARGRQTLGALRALRRPLPEAAT